MPDNLVRRLDYIYNMGGQENDFQKYIENNLVPEKKISDVNKTYQ